MRIIFPLIQGVSNVIVALEMQVLIRPKPLPIILGVPNIIVVLGIKMLMMTKTIANNTGCPQYCSGIRNTSID